jgi:glycerol dehydrogenase-like iron-containing ADH family enzyme
MAEINALIDFCRQIRLPTSLHDLILDDMRPDTLRHVAEAACVANTSDARSLFQITPELLLDAIITADAYSWDNASRWKQRSDYAPSHSNSQSVSVY